MKCYSFVFKSKHEEFSKLCGLVPATFRWTWELRVEGQDPWAAWILPSSSCPHGCWRWRDKIPKNHLSALPRKWSMWHCSGFPLELETFTMSRAPNVLLMKEEDVLRLPGTQWCSTNLGFQVVVHLQKEEGWCLHHESEGDLAEASADSLCRGCHWKPNWRTGDLSSGNTGQGICCCPSDPSYCWLLHSWNFH